jgi:succinate dehydrogenase / fumarate reductase flavoprotein subunit/fumarate reductase flavoprotein subunit
VAESTIFGGRAGNWAAALASERKLRDPGPEQVEDSIARAIAPLRRENGHSPFGITHELKEVMWEGCGVVRARKGLLRARDKIEELEKKAADVAVSGPAQANYAWQEALDVSNQLTVARSMVESALIREESRGSHFRSDFPEQDDERWLRFIVAKKQPDGRVRINLRPVKFSRRHPDPADPSAEELERMEPTEQLWRG